MSNNGKAGTVETTVHETSSSSRFTTVTGTMAPGDDDVLMGRGKRSYNHEGNVRFRTLVAEKAPSYFDTESKKVRRYIAKQIMERIETNGGKFLRPTSTNDGWEVTPNSIVLTKVKQALRDFASGLFSSAQHGEQREDLTQPSNYETPFPNPSITLSTLQLAMYSQSERIRPSINNGNANLMALLQYPGISSAQCSLVVQALERQSELEQHMLMEHRARQLSALLSYQQLRQLPLMPSPLGQAQQGFLGASNPSVPNNDYRNSTAQGNMINAAAFESSRMQTPPMQISEHLLLLLNNQGPLPPAPPQLAVSGSRFPPSFASSTKPDVTEDESEEV